MRVVAAFVAERRTQTAWRQDRAEHPCIGEVDQLCLWHVDEHFALSSFEYRHGDAKLDSALCIAGHIEDEVGGGFDID